MSLNSPTITIAGQLVADPILRKTKSAKTVVNIRIACTPYTFNKETGFEEKETIFVTATAWDKMAENISTSLSKGSRVLVAGQIKSTSWTGKDGKTRTDWEIEIDEIGASLAFSSVTVNSSMQSQPTPDDSIDQFLPPADHWNNGASDETEPF